MEQRNKEVDCTCQAEPALIKWRLFERLVKLEKWTFLKQCKINRVWPMSIYRLCLPIESKCLARSVKDRCLTTAIVNARRDLFRFKCKNKDSLQRWEVEKDVAMTKAYNGFRSKIRNAYVKKLKWIFKHQVIRRRNGAKLKNLKVLGNIIVSQFIKGVYSFGPNKIAAEPWDWKKLVTHLEPILKDCEPLEAERIRWTMANNAAKDKKIMEKEAEFYRKVKRAARWMQSTDITCARDNKSKAVVLMMKHLYYEFIGEYIKTSKMVELEDDPTDRIAQKLDKVLRSSNCPSFLKNLKVLSPKPLRMFAFVKTHKSPIAIRPVVERRDVPTYRVEKALAK